MIELLAIVGALGPLLFFLALIMIRILPMDQLYGFLDIDLTVEGGNDVFNSDQVPDAVIAPDVVIDEDLFSSSGSLNIEQVLCWDIGQLEFFSGLSGDITTGGDILQSISQGLTKDNTVNAGDAPTSDVNAQHTRPGGADSDVSSRYVARAQHFDFANETHDATGQMNVSNLKAHIVQVQPRTLIKGGRDVGTVLTSAHYHHWVDSILTGRTHTMSVGALVRRVDVDFLEIIFDRVTLIGILNAVNQVF